MSVEQALCDRVLSDTAITGMISDRIYPMKLPQNSLFPAIRYQMISDVDDYDLDGKTGLVAKRYQFDMLASTYKDAKTLYRYVKQVLMNFKGTADDKLIHDTKPQSGQDLYDDGDGLVKMYGVSMDVLVYHDE